MNSSSSTLIDTISPSSLLLSQRYVNFQKILNPTKRPDIQLVIKPLTEEYLLQCAKLQAACFCRNNNVYIHFKVPEELFLERVALPLVKKNIKDQIGIVCVDAKTNEVLAQVLNGDYSNEDTEPYYTNRHPLLDRRGRYQEVIRKENTRLFGLFPKGRYETIFVKAVATSPKAEGLGLFTELLRFTMFEHPIIKNSKVLYSVATHPASAYAMLKCGFRTAWTKEWKDYAKHETYEEFAGIAKLGNLNGKVKVNGVLLNVFDRNSLILRPGL